MPILPNQTYDSFGVINPYLIWLIVVLISTISFLSYVSIKVIGPKRGIGASGLLGGLISSTAVSISLAEISKKTKKIVNPFVVGILLASSTMFVRVLLEISFVNPSLVSTLIFPLSVMAVSGLLVSALFWFKDKDSSLNNYSDKDLKLKSPLQLSTALQFPYF